ncbi:ABC transporter substrate-binding protein [Nocardioides astragali]|uniref:ABC transporter substrate-binding protein n=1 Tax=Nocardioides astragali TaxID=1776736 RepID=A0ABW2NCN1_9ACTN|nr:ABC transporter substrate-binding protein [Nocardioides astragali]
MKLLHKSLAALAAATLTLTLAACGGGGEAADANTVEFWYYQPTPEQAQKVQALVDEFEDANSGISIKLVEIPKADYNTKLASAMAGDRGPDAGYLDQPQMARFADADQIVEVPAGTIDDADFYEGALQTNMVDGKLYGVPLQQTTVVLFYNTDLVSTPPKTWDELVAVSEDVNNENPDVAGVAVPKGDGFGAWMYPGFVASAGGTMLDEKNKKVTFADVPAEEALDLWHTLLESSPREITNSDLPFQKGLAAMMFSGPWDIVGIREQFPQLKFDVALMPMKETEASTIGGDNGVVFSGADNEDAAFKWLQFLSDETHNAEFADITGNFPTNIAAAEASTLADDPQIQVVLQQLETAHARPAVADWIQINDEYIARAIEAAVDGDTPPADALDEAAERAAKLLGWS